MRKSVILVVAVAGMLLLLLLLLLHRDDKTGTRGGPETPSQASAVTNTTRPPNDARIGNESESTEAMPSSSMFKSAEAERSVRSFNETANGPVAFYGQVVDQDANPLENVNIGVWVSEYYMKPSLVTVRGNITNLHRRTGADGRFEISDLKGHEVTISEVMKAGYEGDMGVYQGYGSFGAQSGSFNEPVLFRLWSTNIPHQELITGEKWFSIIPDGRPYRVDLTNGVISEGTGGDFVVSTKCPASAGMGELFEWSCELAATAGGLSEESANLHRMTVAPATGYTNKFTYQMNAGADGWMRGFDGRRFYVRLHDGQIYGRIAFTLAVRPSSEGPSKVGFKYAVNPSGSRYLR